MMGKDNKKNDFTWIIESAKYYYIGEGLIGKMMKVELVKNVY